MRTEAEQMAEIERIHDAWQPARYGADRRPNLPAVAASGLVVAGLLSSFIALNLITVPTVARQPPITVELLPEPRLPTPPPPRTEPDRPVEALSPIVAPKPLVTIPAPTVEIATSPVPAPAPVSLPGPPSPVSQPAPPAIENAGNLSSRMIEARPPRYPVDSRRRREEGTVVLLVLLGVDGRVADVSVHRSSGFARLDDAALQAVKRWRWSPTRRDGTPVMVKGLVEIPFVLTT